MLLWKTEVFLHCTGSNTDNPARTKHLNFDAKDADAEFLCCSYFSARAGSEALSAQQVLTLQADRARTTSAGDPLLVTTKRVAPISIVRAFAAGGAQPGGRKTGISDSGILRGKRCAKSVTGEMPHGKAGYTRQRHVRK